MMLLSEILRDSRQKSVQSGLILFRETGKAFFVQQGGDCACLDRVRPALFRKAHVNNPAVGLGLNPLDVPLLLQLVDECRNRRFVAVNRLGKLAHRHFLVF